MTSGSTADHHHQPAAAADQSNGRGRWRVAPCYTALALISPRGAIVSLYSFSDRERAEEDVARFNASQDLADIQADAV